ncbi:MAG: S26 family signal peptidase, partial [Puniceicoccales bacterium]|nr:S26 family signal peptidase [Puniceicoccales bacterium]
MFSKKNKTKSAAKYLLSIAERIENYRKDVLTKEQWNTLIEARSRISGALTLPPEEANKNFDEIDALLKSIGGGVYPTTGLVENAEVFLFAAILALAVRAFFFQPFRIPTNSMWPTYAGMTFELIEGEKSTFEKFKRWAFLGASHYSARANDTGTLQIPITTRKDKTGPYGGILYYKVVDTRKFFGLLPSQEREYTFIVGTQYTVLRVPLEFSFDDVALATLFPQAKSWNELFSRQSSKNFHKISVPGKNHEDKISYFDTGIQKSAGEAIFNFDVLSGDMLFVDKVSYHFRSPKIGDAFV